MFKQWIQRLRADPPPEPAPDESAGALADQSLIQTLRLELQDRDGQIDRLSQEIERLRERAEALAAETAAARIESLLAELAGPASQLLTQADLLEAHARPVQARDVLAVARRMVRALERHGLQFSEPAGAPVQFDPGMHTPIGDAPIQPGQPATVRFAGARYQGKILYKAVVERDGSCQDG